MTTARLLAFAVAAVAVACGGAAAPASPSPSAKVTATIAYEKFAVAPQQVNIRAGEAVTWTNKDSATHTVTSGAPTGITKAFDTKQVPGGQSVTIAFDKAGTYDFFCEFHASMRGTVLVK